jgi:acyl-CoA dehydrogenase
MNFEYSDKIKSLQAKLGQFMDEHIYPIEHEYESFVNNHENFWKVFPGMEDLKAKAKAAGLGIYSYLKSTVI